MTNFKISIATTLAVCVGGSTGCFLLPPKDHFALGMQATQARNYPEAQKEFNQVPPNNYRFQEAQFQLGAVLYALHNADGALQQMVKARALNPELFEKEVAMVKGLGLVHAELTRRWNVKTDGTIEDVQAAGDVLFTVTQDGTLSAHRHDQLLWENPLGPRGAYGRAIPVVDGDLVYVVKNKRPAQLLALKLETGETAWTHDLGTAYEFANVAVDRQAVYVGDGAHSKFHLVALDKHSGRELWSTPTAGIPGAIVAGEGRVCAHTKDNHILCVSADGQNKLIDYPLAGQVHQTQLVMTADALFVSLNDSVYALKFASAPLMWKQTLQEGELSAAGLVDEGRKLVVQTRSALHAYDAKTGSPLWLVSSPREDGAWNRAGKIPADLGGTIVGWGKSFAFGVTPDGHLVWQLAVDGSLSAAPISVGDGTLVLAVHGQKQELVANAPRNLFN
jgi:outer membrane protein assembly factor BamB